MKKRLFVRSIPSVLLAFDELSVRTDMSKTHIRSDNTSLQLAPHYSLLCVVDFVESIALEDFLLKSR